MLMSFVQANIGVSVITEFQMNLPSRIITWIWLRIKSTQPTHHASNRTRRKTRWRMTEGETTTIHMSSGGWWEEHRDLIVIHSTRNKNKTVQMSHHRCIRMRIG